MTAHVTLLRLLERRRSPVSEAVGVLRRHRKRQAERERERQLALARSWHGAQQDLADPAFRAYLEQSLERLNRKYEPQHHHG